MSFLLSSNVTERGATSVYRDRSFPDNVNKTKIVSCDDIILRTFEN